MMSRSRPGRVQLGYITSSDTRVGRMPFFVLIVFCFVLFWFGLVAFAFVFVLCFCFDLCFRFLVLFLAFLV